jgi:hypothetical protein
MFAVPWMFVVPVDVRRSNNIRRSNIRRSVSNALVDNGGGQ